jgi:Ca-activated chloride channel family protein
MNKAFGPRVVLVVGIVLAAVPFWPDSLLAQSPRFKSGVELVPLTVTVTDRAGRYMPELTAADFAIFEEGRRQAITHFAAGDASIDIGFLLDTSDSMRDKLHLAQKAARGLVQQLRAGDRGAVAGIGSTVSLHQPMTSDLARVDQALQSTQASGNTALYDALYIVLRQYQQERQRFTDVRRQVVVLLSDGIDTSSHVTFQDVLDLVRRVEATIYVVSLGEDPAMLKNVLGDRSTFESAHTLHTLARESGGRLFTPRTARELPAIYDAIAEELSHQYVIGYLPSQGADGTFRRISVGVLQPRVGVARTRAGYYADRSRTGESASSYSARSFVDEGSTCPRAGTTLARCSNAIAVRRQIGVASLSSGR